MSRSLSRCVFGLSLALLAVLLVPHLAWAEDAGDGEPALIVVAQEDELAELGDDVPEEVTEEVVEAAEPAAEDADEVADDSIEAQAGPNYGGASWKLDGDTLTITAMSSTDKLSNPWDEDAEDWPWLGSNAKKVKHVRFVKSGSTYVVASTCDGMFKGCSNLVDVDLSGLDNTKALNFADMFKGCAKLDYIKVGARYDVCPAGVPTKSQAFPNNPRATGYWWSDSQGCFVSNGSIRKNHAGTGAADTYRTGKSLTSVSLVDMGDDESHTYTGKAIKVTPRLFMDKEGGGTLELKYGRDIKLLGYEGDTTNVGTVKAKVGALQGGLVTDYEGFYLEYSYSISSRLIVEADVEMDGAFDYTGAAVTPEPKLTFGGKVLTKGTDYTLSYKNNVKPGTGTMTIKGKGNFAGKATVDFEILNPLTNLTYAKITGVSDVVYNGQAHTPVPVVTLDGKTLVEGKDYKVTYEDNVKPGRAFVNIEALGAYEGETWVRFTIAFKDVPKGFWGYGKVHEAASLGLVSGYTGAQDGYFGPGDNVTRGQAAVILWNMAEKPKAGSGAKEFSDVSSGKFYYGAVRWASSVGVVSGYANDTFGPEDLVTREQLAVMIANYAAKVGKLEVSGSAADYAAMVDAASVSGFAKSSLGWCFGKGILSGTADKHIMPQGNATRAETAKMMCNLFDLVDAD